MSQTPNTAIAVIGIDIGKNSFHVVGHDARGAGAVPSSSGKSPARSVSRACDGQVENGSWQIRKSPHDCRLDQTVCCSLSTRLATRRLPTRNTLCSAWVGARLTAHRRLPS